MICPVCLQGPTQDLLEGLRGCHHCDHIYQYPLEVKAVYDKRYIEERYDRYPTTPEMSALRLGMLKPWIEKGTLLDVGYGNGSFVKQAIKGGFDAYGCDVHGADYGVREVALTEKRHWDVVTFFDALEHFTDLDIIRELSCRTSMILISYPNRPSTFPKDRSWKHYRPGEHLHYFSLVSLSKLFPNKDILFTTAAEDAIRGGGRDGHANIQTVMLA